MRRLPFALCTTTLAALLAAAGGASTGTTFEQRLEAFRKRSDAERRASGLDFAALKRKYPTPELSLVSTGAAGSSPVCLAPGRTAELVLDAKLVPGSFVDFSCDGLSVLEQRAEGAKLRIKARAKEDALPQRCDLLAVSPVSGIQASVLAARVGGRYTWDLQLDNGLSSRWVVDATRCEDAELRGTSTWTRKGKALGERPVSLGGAGSTWRAQVEATPEEMQETSDALQGQQASSGTEEAIEKMTALSQKMGEECVKLPPEKMQPCFERYQKLLAPYQQRLQAAGDQMQQTSSVRKVGCQELELAVGAGGAVTGTGSGCGAPGDTAVKGKVAVSAAAAAP